MKFRILLILLLTGCVSASAQHNWRSKWISCSKNDATKNSFFAYRKQVSITQRPATAIARIAADSKYWLWVNGKVVVREGSLKRGPNMLGTYYDEIDIAPYLVAGNNTIAVMVWYFGIGSFSHWSSGRSALLFDCQTDSFDILSDGSWQCSWLAAYQTAGDPAPNFRLSESSVLFDATKDIGNWQSDLSIPLDQAIEVAVPGEAPWYGFIKRPVPLWKDYGLKNYISQSTGSDNGSNMLTATLPYNAQVTPYFKINAPAAGLKITIYTDTYLPFNGGWTGLRFEYITRQGEQEFEIPGWINGHKVHYVLAKGISIIDIKYRETGYDARLEGSFQCSDPFFNTLWQKAARTLYVNMRDGYMDCPDRERAQWPADAVHASGQAFYALSPESHALAGKWFDELLRWRKEDGTIYGPVPGTWVLDLPDQTLTTIGYYGIWNYFMHSGDKQTLEKFYPAIKKYLTLWDFDNTGLVRSRPGYAFWGDRTENKDIRVIVNALYYMTLKCLQQTALVLGLTQEADSYTLLMQHFHTSFNQQFWNGKSYRDPQYKEATDDRAQALSVVAGLAAPDKFAAILDVLKKEEHASTYMEKFVMEALFQMGYGEYALTRSKKRFEAMVTDERFSTLWEDWSLEPSVHGISTIDHAWSGGGLTILSQYLCGIEPLESAYKTFQVMPRTAGISSAAAKVSSVAGLIESSYELSQEKFSLTTKVPAGTRCIMGIANRYECVLLNGEKIWERGAFRKNSNAVLVQDSDTSHLKFKVTGGTWELVALTPPKANRNVLNLDMAVKTDSVLCKGDTLILSAPGNKKWQWYRNDSLLKHCEFPFLNVWDSGVYYAVTPAIAGRTDTTRKYQVRIGHGSVPVQPFIQVNNKTLVASADSNLQWYRNGVLINGATNKTYTPVSNAVYTVRAGVNGCSNISNPVFHLVNTSFTIDDNQYISFFPNPAKDHINVLYKLATNKPVQLSISNLNGSRLINIANLQSGDRVPLDGLNHGIYIVTISVAGESWQYATQLVK